MGVILGGLVAYHDPVDDQVKPARVVHIHNGSCVNLLVFEPLLNPDQWANPIKGVTSVVKGSGPGCWVADLTTAEG